MDISELKCPEGVYELSFTHTPHTVERVQDSEDSLEVGGSVESDTVEVTQCGL